MHARTFWHRNDSMIQACKQPADSQTILGSIRKDDEVSLPREIPPVHRRQQKMGPTLFSRRRTNQTNIYEDIFNRQKEYFATNITRSYEWRVDQLDRLARLLSEHTN